MHVPDLGLVAADRVSPGAVLALHVSQVEVVGIGQFQVECAHAHQAGGCGTADAPGADDADHGIAQPCLAFTLFLGGVAEPTQVAVNAFPVEVLIVVPA